MAPKFVNLVYWLHVLCEPNQLWLSVVDELSFMQSQLGVVFLNAVP